MGSNTRNMGGGEGYMSGVLNVSFHGNEILNFNREINRVFHSSTSFPRQITCFFSEFSAEFRRVSNERAADERAHSGRVRLGIRWQLEGVGECFWDDGT